VAFATAILPVQIKFTQRTATKHLDSQKLA